MCLLTFETEEEIRKFLEYEQRELTKKEKDSLKEALEYYERHSIDGEKHE